MLKDDEQHEEKEAEILAGDGIEEGFDLTNFDFTVPTELPRKKKIVQDEQYQ